MTPPSDLPCNKRGQDFRARDPLSLGPPPNDIPPPSLCPASTRSPSLSGQDVILAEICKYLDKDQLSRMVRVNSECFAIAGQALYRSVTVHDYRHSALGKFLAPWEQWGLEPDNRPLSRTKGELLKYVQHLDISEKQAILLASTHGAGKRCPHPLIHLDTLVLRAKQHMDMDYDTHMTHQSRFADGWSPKRLVLIGDVNAIPRIFSYSRSPSPPPLIDGDIPIITNRLWSSVLHMTHIIRNEGSASYPGVAYFHPASREISRVLPNLLTYHLFFDMYWAARQRRHPLMNIAELHFARAVSWIIRYTPPDLPLTIWLSGRAHDAFVNRRRFINDTIRQPFDEASAAEQEKGEVSFEEWDEEKFLARVARVRARLCHPHQEERWCEVSDGAMYEDVLVTGGQFADGRSFTVGNEDAGLVDWADVKSWDRGEDYDSGEEVDEEESEEDDENEIWDAEDLFDDDDDDSYGEEEDEWS